MFSVKSCMELKKQSGLIQTLQTQWLAGGWLSNLLLPLSWLTALVVRIKRGLYASGLKKQNHLPVPVIVVGNIFVGGTGKTPFVLALVAALRERGWQPGIISRGYGVKIGPQPRHAYGANAAAAEIGDEPAMLAAAAPIAVHPDRASAAQCLLQHYPETTVIIADDGLQHLALARDIEIVVQDARGVGNARLLPAGPLREPPSRLNTIDFLISNASNDVSLSAPGTEAARRQRDKQTGPRRIVMQLVPTQIIHLKSGLALDPAAWLERHRSTNIVAIAGIGHPPRFFRTLEHAGITVRKTIAFPDHHPFSEEELAGIQADAILMTTKDAAKCRNLQDDRPWAVAVSPRFSDGNFFDEIAQKLESLPLY